MRATEEEGVEWRWSGSVKSPVHSTSSSLSSTPAFDEGASEELEFSCSDWGKGPRKRSLGIDFLGRNRVGPSRSMVGVRLQKVVPCGIS